MIAVAKLAEIVGQLPTPQLIGAYRYSAAKLQAMNPQNVEQGEVLTVADANTVVLDELFVRVSAGDLTGGELEVIIDEVWDR